MYYNNQYQPMQTSEAIKQLGFATEEVNAIFDESVKQKLSKNNSTVPNQETPKFNKRLDSIMKPQNVSFGKNSSKSGNIDSQ